MGKGGAVLGIIGIILAAGAIGFTFIVWNGQNTTTKSIVVGIWDTLDDNQDYAPYDSANDWLIEFGGNNLSNTEYLAVSRANTRIALLKPGWYRIHLSVLLDTISPDCMYWVILLKDGEIDFYFYRLHTSATLPTSFHSIDSSGFVYSDGTNYIEIRAWSNGDSYFSINSLDTFNQINIEYVAT